MPLQEFRGAAVVLLCENEDIGHASLARRFTRSSPSAASSG
jgi:hypothetical protein